MHFLKKYYFYNISAVLFPDFEKQGTNNI